MTEGLNEGIPGRIFYFVLDVRSVLLDPSKEGRGGESFMLVFGTFIVFSVGFLLRLHLPSVSCPLSGA